MTTATQMRLRAIRVLRVRGMWNRGTHSRAVSTSSIAVANAFKIEFSFFRKILVRIPYAEVFMIMRMTKGSLRDSKVDGVNTL